MDLLNMVWRDLNNARIWKNAPDRVRGIYRDHYARYRSILPQARPFNVSNQALKVALELSVDGPEKMAQRLFMARLPFPKMWIEFDFHERVRLGQALGIASELDPLAPERIGWLLQEDPSDPLRWSATTWATVDNNQPVHVPQQGQMLTSNSLYVWMVDTANRVSPERMGNINPIDQNFIKDVIKVSDRATEKHGADSWRSFAHLGWGYSAAETQGPLADMGIDRMRQLTIADSLRNSISVGFEPMSYQMFKEQHTTDTFREQFVTSTMEARGDVRLIATLLSLINEVPIVETPSQKKGSFSGAGGVVRKYLTNKTVTINIPGKRPIRQVRKFLASKIKSHKARHEVRGHWRTIIHKEDHTRKRTQPDGTIVEEFIAKGQLERVWVNHHERGDASVGFVKHDYKVEKSGRTGNKSQP